MSTIANDSEAVALAVERTELTQQSETTIILPFEIKEEFTVEEPKSVNNSSFYKATKRAFDIIVSFCMLLVLILPMAIIGVIIKFSSKGPVLYTQERLGKNGVPFKMIKFRTMVVGSEKDGAQWSSGKEDSRIYPFGRVLRDLRLDELPQLWSIFIGKMSFVGPRPERECFYNEFEKYVHGFSHRLKVTPGLTGLAQVSGGYELKPEEKIVYDMEYINNQSLLLDLKIIFKTVAVVFTHEGAK